MDNLEGLEPIHTNNLSDSVYVTLRRWIIDQHFQPGERLHLPQIEQSLQVSRTPLKIAMKRLEAEGFIDIHPRRGTFIAQTNPDRLEESYKIRSSFELYVALCLFKYLKNEDYRFFDTTRSQMISLVEESGTSWREIVPDYLALDQAFHERLVAVGGPARMLDLFQQMQVHTQMIPIVQRYHTRDFQAMHFEHQQIFASITDRSPERLNATLLNHLESARYRALSHSRERS